MDRPVRVLLVDDHRAFAEVLEFVLALQPGIDVIGVATTGRQALEQVRQHRPDVVLLDYYLPDTHGVSVLCGIRQQAPETKVVLLTAETRPDVVRAAIDAGASGYLSKHGAVQQVVDAVRAVAAGNLVVPPGEPASILSAFRRSQPTIQRHAAPHGITPRERDVLGCLMENLEYDAIARRLVISPKTVCKHIQNLFSKLGVHSKAELLVFALREGLVEPPRRQRGEG